MKVTKQELKNYLLDKYIDSEGKKVSDRSLWSTEEFYEYTGLFRLDEKTGKRLPVSTGTISYWKSKLCILEEDVFRYHQMITKRIPEDWEYEIWSKKYNKGHDKTFVITTETVKRRLVKYAGLSEIYYNFTFEVVSKAVSKVWADTGLDPILEMNKFYAELYTANLEEGD